ncbi:MAG: hypothetical protein HRT45_06260 [Bdellovibrionales bacterium]|nr:hypothetical protein [Bdellovibrionales bacterium]
MILSLSNWNAWVTRRTCTGSNSIGRTTTVVNGQRVKRSHPAWDDINGHRTVYRCKSGRRDFVQYTSSQRNQYSDLFNKYYSNPGGSGNTHQWKRNFFPQFVDHFVKERTRNIEPSSENFDCYYQLMRYSLLAKKRNQSDISMNVKNRLESSSVCNFDLRR